MSNLTIVLIVAVVVMTALVAWLLVQRRCSQHLRTKFGPEYHRTVAELGDRTKAERDLARREQHVAKLNIRPLPPAERDRYLRAWQADQARFVDDPSGAVSEADRLVAQVMAERGYPMGDFEHRVEDISVDHPHLVQNYRLAREIAGRQKNGQASTEDLRKALVYYRALFDELLEVQEATR